MPVPSPLDERIMPDAARAIVGLALSDTGLFICIEAERHSGDGLLTLGNASNLVSVVAERVPD